MATNSARGAIGIRVVGVSLGAIASAVAFGWVGALAAVPAAGLWWLGTRWTDRVTAGWTLGIAAWLHFAVCASGFYSNDLHRYLFEGAMMLDGTSPYAVAPADSRLAASGDARLVLVLQPNLPSPYPPLAQATFLIGAALGADEHAYRNGIVLLNLATVGLLLAWLRATGRTVGGAACYAWSPVAVISACGGHVDVVMLGLLIGFVWAWESERARLAGCLLGMAVLVKGVPALMLPWALWRRPRAMLATALPVIALGYAPLLPFGEAWGSLPTLAREFRFNAPVHLLLDSLLGGFAPIAAAVLLTLIIGLIAIRVDEPAEASVWAMIGLLLVAPVVHYWYLTWFLVLLPGVRRGALRSGALAWAMSVSSLVPSYLAISRGEELPSAPFAWAIQALVPSCAVTLELWRTRRARRDGFHDLPFERGPLAA